MRRRAAAIIVLLASGCGGGSVATSDAGDGGDDAAADAAGQASDPAGGEIGDAGDRPAEVGGDGSGTDAPDGGDAGTGTDAGTLPRRGRIAVGDGFACALDAAGALRCWGERVTAPVPAGTGFKYVAAGADGMCAIDASGAVVCWTRDATGSSAIDQAVPAPPLTEVTVGGDRFAEFACALRAGGETLCWRDADETPLPDLTTPPAGVSLTRIAAGTSHVCGLGAGGMPTCWGHSGTPALSGVPAKPFVDVASGVLFSCGLASTGSPTCWGTTFYADEFPPATVAVALAAARASLNPIICALLGAGQVLCSAASAPYPGPPDKAQRFEEIAVGTRHVCAVARDRSVVCWSAETHVAGDVVDVPAGLMVPAR